MSDPKAVKLPKLIEGCPGCDLEDCQDCCTHDDRDHGICPYCGHEQDPGELIDRAMDFYEGDR